jgi:hypothetical protein
MVLYRCKTWSLILREEHRRRVFDCRVLRRIFRPKRDEMIERWRILHIEQLHKVYFSSNNYNDEVRQIEMGRARTQIREMNAYRVLVGKP